MSMVLLFCYVGVDGDGGVDVGGCCVGVGYGIWRVVVVAGVVIMDVSGAGGIVVVDDGVDEYTSDVGCVVVDCGGGVGCGGDGDGVGVGYVGIDVGGVGVGDHVDVDGVVGGVVVECNKREVLVIQCGIDNHW